MIKFKVADFKRFGDLKIVDCIEFRKKRSDYVLEYPGEGKYLAIEEDGNILAVLCPLDLRVLNRVASEIRFECDIGNTTNLAIKRLSRKINIYSMSEFKASSVILISRAYYGEIEDRVSYSFISSAKNPVALISPPLFGSGMLEDLAEGR